MRVNMYGLVYPEFSTNFPVVAAIHSLTIDPDQFTNFKCLSNIVC